MTAAEQKIATSFRAYEEQQSALKKAGAANAVQVGRGRIHSVRAVDIVVYPERNIRPIDRKTVESYKQKFRDGLTPPASMRRWKKAASPWSMATTAPSPRKNWLKKTRILSAI